MTAEQIRALRARRKWTQQDLANMLGVAVSSVGRWERLGGRPPKGASLRALQRLAADAPSITETRSEDTGGQGARPDSGESGPLRNAVVELVGSMSCPKEFACTASGFKELCRARDVGLLSHLECLEPGSAGCAFSTAFESAQLCDCPLRLYVYQKLKR